MNVLKAILMGIVQGLTEFLPVSSSGHLGLIKGLFGMDSQSILFDVLLPVATLISICAVFYKDVLRLVIEFGGMCRDIFGNAAALGRSLTDGKTPEYARVISSPSRSRLR